MNLVDSNVLIDLVQNDPRWADWSEHALQAGRARGGLAINPVVYAELASSFTLESELRAVVGAAGLRLLPIPPEAAFLAGHAFLAYRRRRGVKTGVLPDFFIGAHAAVAGMRLITRDAGRYRTYFPDVTLITPDG